MTGLAPFLRRLAADAAGSMLIETAMVAPALIVMCVGGYEISAIVARQSVLQSTAGQATEIVIVAAPETEVELDQIRGVLQTTGGLSDGDIILAFKYRCGVEPTLANSPPMCSAEALSTFVSIRMTDQYEPVWTQWGFGKDLVYRVNRTVQVS